VFVDAVCEDVRFVETNVFDGGTRAWLDVALDANHATRLILASLGTNSRQRHFAYMNGINSA
jgi:hypothetical protein